MDHILRELEAFYESNTIYRACILCENEEDVQTLARLLEDNYHTVLCITDEDVQDERPLYADKLNAFKHSYRIVIMSYASWHAIKDTVEMKVLPEQNLMVVINLDEGVVSYVARYLKDAYMRGFAYSNAQLESFFLVFSQ